MSLPLKPIEQLCDDLIKELLELFKKEQFEILGARNIRGYRHPSPIKNDGYGDQENKSPDVFAFDPQRRVYSIGIAKTGEGDLDSEHSLTQYNVFLDHHHQESGEPSRLYIIVPASKVNDLTAIITHYIHREYWQKIFIVSSQKYD